ncbi:MAG: hypothetical protein J0L64_11640 [Acidobacteria bacterium]|nr:hypothetical protein [Acidobacteriota bacterium]
MLKPIEVRHTNPGATGHGGGIERFNREVRELLKGSKFETVDELNSFLKQKLASGELNSKLDVPRQQVDPVDQAQELCWQAMDAPSPARARKLYDEALSLDPDCTDALIYKAGRSKNLIHAVELLERAVLKAAGRLGGQAFFQKNTGHFWGITETRPYMRAKAALAETYVEAGRQLDAIAEYEHMLELCPNDNLGVRYILLGKYLRAAELHRSRRLLNSYEETSAMFLYARTVLAVLDQDLTTAKRVLGYAIRANPYVYEILARLRDEPLEEGPEFYSPGEESEAAMVLECLGEAFLSSPAVALWFHDQSVARGHRPKSPHLDIPLQ